MRCASIYSSNIDSYEAGLEIAESLIEVEPQVVLLFTSIQYDYSELLEGMSDVFDYKMPLIVGGTGDGVYETNGVYTYGATALGLGFEHEIKTSLAFASGGDQNPFDVAKECASKNVKELGGTPDFAFCFADLSCDGTQVTEGLFAGGLKVFQGGLTGDDWQFKEGRVYMPQGAFQGSIVSLALKNDLSFRLNTASGWKPVGSPGFVEEAEGNIIRRINGLSTFDFIYQELGMPLAEAAFGVLPLAAYIEDKPDLFLLRTPRDMNIESGQITYFGGIEEGTKVRVCSASKEDIINGVNNALSNMQKLDFTPKCAVIVSCGARKMMLGDQVNKELEILFKHIGKSIPVTGYVSFGEIGPFWNDNDYTRSYFHNVSYVINLIGAKE